MKWTALFSIASFVVLNPAAPAAAFFIANSVTLTGRYDRSTDHAYGPESRQKLDVYSPKDAKDRPVVVFFYGGRGPWGAGGFIALSERHWRSGG